MRSFSVRLRAACVGAAAILLLAGCVTRPERQISYYTLDYLAETERHELRREVPHEAGVRILDTRVARAYNRPQMVTRGIGPAIEYLSNELWGVDLAETVADLVQSRIRAYRTFARTTREFTREVLEYELRSAVRSIEYVVAGDEHHAVIHLELSLMRLPDESETVRHVVRAESPLPAGDIAVFVTEVNRLMLAEIDAFLEKAGAYLDTGEPVLEDPDLAADRRERPVPVDATEGAGEVLLPAVGPRENQPYFTLRSLDNDLELPGRFGTPIVVPAGRYAAEFGAGPPDQRLRLEDIEVFARRRTIVEPTWAALTVEVIDTARTPVRLRYDVYDAWTGESYGGMLSSSEQVATPRRVWILAPGRYKVVLNSQPFTSLVDFVTVTLASGSSEELTMVVGTDNRLQGAGNLVAVDVDDPESPFRISVAAHSSLSFTMQNEDGARDFTTLLILDSEVESDLTYERAPFRYDLRNLVRIGLSTAEGAPLRVTSDRFRLRNTLRYGITSVFGLYARLDADTFMVGGRATFTEPRDYVKRDGDTVVEQGEEVRLVRLSPPFMPLTLRQGAGLSIQAVRAPRLDLGLRGGIGATQTIRHQTWEFAHLEDSGGTDVHVFEPADTSMAVGLEFSAFATVIPPWNTSITSEAELFVPFGENAGVSFAWENTLSVVLARNASLLYRFALRTSDEAAEARLVQEHGVFVRLSYLFRR